MANASRDENFVPTLLGASSADGVTPVKVYANPSTHRLLTDAGAGVTGPISSTDNAVVRFDGTTGQTIQNSTAIINDSGHLSLNGSSDFTAPLSIKGGSDYGQVELINTAGTKIGGYGISDSDDQIIIGSAAGNLAIWNGQAIDFSADAGVGNAVTITAGSDLAVNIAAKGLILTSDNGTKFRVHVNNAGTLVVTAI